MDGRERSGCGWVEMVLENELEMEWMANTPHLLEVEEEEEVGRPAHPAEGYIVHFSIIWTLLYDYYYYYSRAVPCR